MERNSLDWGPEITEDPEAVDAALQRVRSEGNKKKTVRRSAVGSTLALVLVVGVAAQSYLTDQGNGSNSNHLAAPTNSTPMPTIPTPVQETPFNPTLASQVIDKAHAVYGATTGISGIVSRPASCDPNDTKCDPAKLGKSTTEFRFRDNGDAWVRNVDTSKDGSVTSDDITTFHSSDNRATTVFVKSRYPTQDRTVFSDTTLHPYGNLDREVFGDFTLPSLLDGLSLDQQSSLESTQVNGRDAWRIHAKGLELDGLGTSPDEVVATFDKSTLFPLSAKELLNGRVLADITISTNANPTFSDADFTVDTRGMKVTDRLSIAGEWKAVGNVDELAKLTSYKPIVPATVPEGFTVSTITHSKDARHSGAEGLNSSNKDVAMITYRHGLQSIVVTTRLVGAKPKEWIDPLSLEGQQNLNKTNYVISGGTNNAITAEIVSGFGVTPHAWAVGTTLVTTISGDVSIDELKTMLNSLGR